MLIRRIFEKWKKKDSRKQEKPKVEKKEVERSKIVPTGSSIDVSEIYEEVSMVIQVNKIF